MRPIRLENGEWKCPICGTKFSFPLIRDPFHIYDERPNYCKHCEINFEWEHYAATPPRMNEHQDGWNDCISYLIDHIEEFHNSLNGRRYDYFPLEDLQEWLEDKRQ